GTGDGRRGGLSLRRPPVGRRLSGSALCFFLCALARDASPGPLPASSCCGLACSLLSGASTLVCGQSTDAPCPFRPLSLGVLTTSATSARGPAGSAGYQQDSQGEERRFTRLGFKGSLQHPSKWGK